MIISTRVPADLTSASHLVKRGMCRQIKRSIALSASTVPLHRPTVATPTRSQEGTAFTHIS